MLSETRTIRGHGRELWFSWSFMGYHASVSLGFPYTFMVFVVTLLKYDHHAQRGVQGVRTPPP